MQIKFNITAGSEAKFHPDTLTTLREMGDVVALDWLKDVLCEIDRLMSLPFWIEEISGDIPGDAELLSWQTVGDAERWMGVVA